MRIVSIFGSSAFVLLSCQAAHAFAPTCSVMDTDAYEEQVVREAFERAGNLDPERLKGIIHEIRYRDHFNCRPERAEDGRYAKLSEKRNDQVSDVYIYDKENTPYPNRVQLKDLGEQRLRDLCKDVNDGVYGFATIVLSKETYDLLQKLRTPGQDNHCSRMTKPGITASPFSTDDNVRIARSKANQYMVRVDRSGQVVDSGGVPLGKAPLDLASINPEEQRKKVAEALARREEMLRHLEDQDAHHRQMAEERTTKRKERIAANDNKPFAGLRKMEQETGRVMTEAAGILLESKVGKVVIAGTVVTVSRISIPEDRIPVSVLKVAKKAGGVLARLPYIKGVALASTVIGSGLVTFEIYMSDDPDADVESRLREVAHILAKEGIVAVGSIGGAIAGMAAGMAISPVCGPAAPACAVLFGAGGVIVGSETTSLALDYAYDGVRNSPELWSKTKQEFSGLVSKFPDVPMPTVSMPTFTMPSMPTFTMPEVSIPTRPWSQLTLPDLSVPKLPSLSVDLPSMSLPEGISLPEITLPSLSGIMPSSMTLGADAVQSPEAATTESDLDFESFFKTKVETTPALQEMLPEQLERVKRLWRESMSN